MTYFRDFTTVVVWMLGNISFISMAIRFIGGENMSYYKRSFFLNFKRFGEIDCVASMFFFNDFTTLLWVYLFSNISVISMTDSFIGLVWFMVSMEEM